LAKLIIYLIHFKNMVFEFTLEQNLFRETIRNFAQKEIAPYEALWDRTGEFPKELFKKLVDIGLMGIRIPEKYGGQGADAVTTGIAIEELSRYDFNVANFIIINNALTAEVISNYAKEEVKEEILPKVANGEVILGIALTEPHCGTDAAAIKTTAYLDGDEWVINGEKSSISMVKYASYYVLFAKTDPKAGHKGISAFLVPAKDKNITYSYFDDVGYRPISRGAFKLDNVRIPKDYLLGNIGEGFYIVMKTFDFSKTLLALSCLGAAEQSLEETIEYAKKRYAFGKPIIKFEAIQFEIVEYYTYLEACKLLCYRTLWMKDKGMPIAKYAAMCKMWAPKLAFEIIHKCILIHGNIAYTRDLPFERRLRNVMGIEIGDGTEEAQKIVLGRELIGKEYAPHK
jgi:cyclohexanecarboxyl-CoA dehydrogenase